MCSPLHHDPVAAAFASADALVEWFTADAKQSVVVSDLRVLLDKMRSGGGGGIRTGHRWEYGAYELESTCFDDSTCFEIPRMPFRTYLFDYVDDIRRTLSDRVVSDMFDEADIKLLSMTIPGEPIGDTVARAARAVISVRGANLMADAVRHAAAYRDDMERREQDYHRMLYERTKCCS